MLAPSRSFCLRHKLPEVNFGVLPDLSHEDTLKNWEKKEKKTQTVLRFVRVKVSAGSRRQKVTGIKTMCLSCVSRRLFFCADRRSVLWVSGDLRIEALVQDRTKLILHLTHQKRKEKKRNECVVCVR